MDKNMDGKLSLEEFIEVDINIYIHINLFAPISDLFKKDICCQVSIPVSPDVVC